MGFVKNLRFMYEDLPKDFHLVFTFDDQTIEGHTMYENLFPIAWKIAYLQKGGAFEFSETYTQQFAFATAQIESGIVKTSSAVRDIEFKQETTVTGDPQSGFNWSTPVVVGGIADDQFAAKNGTDSVREIAVCSHVKGTFAQPLLFLDASVDGILLAQFTPRLRIYAVSDMKQSAIIKVQISSKVLWDHLLNEPGLSDDWNIDYEQSTGNLNITPIN